MLSTDEIHASERLASELLGPLRNALLAIYLICLCMLFLNSL
jgi:hypothetical protein